MNDYIVSTSIKCSDGKIHQLGYDLTEQTEGSIYEFGRVFTEIEKRFPDVHFWIGQYPETKEDSMDYSLPFSEPSKYNWIHHPDGYETPNDYYKDNIEVFRKQRIQTMKSE